jgi:competence protein ComEC
LFISTIFLGGLFLSNTFILPSHHIRNFSFHKSGPVLIKGIVISLPETKPNHSSFILSAEELTQADKVYSVTGKVLVRVFKNGTFSYGDRVLLEGSLYRPFSFSREFNYREYLKHRGIYCILSVKKKSLVKQLARDTANPLKSLILRLRLRMKEVIRKNLSFFSSSILNAIILGDRQDLSFYVRDTLLKSGTVHIIAISGLHIGIVAFIILVMLKVLRIPRKPRYILTILILIIYCILTGANTPVVRATIMAVVLLFTYFLKREVNIYNSLALAALIILILNPWQLFEVSFQLSFLSVVSLVWLSPKVKSMFPERLYRIAWIRFLILAFSVSVAVSLGLLPLIAYYFKIITPITILANMIIVPYVTIIVASGFSLALIGMLFSPLAPIFAASCELSILMLFKINSLLISIPGAYFKLPSISFVYILLYYSLLIIIFNLSKISFKQPFTKYV